MRGAREFALHVVSPVAGAAVRRLATVALTAAFLAVAAVPAFALDTTPSPTRADSALTTPPQRLRDRVTAVGSPGRARTIPGSVAFIGDEPIAHLNHTFDDIHRLLWRVPGMVAIDTEYGLRPDIGMRATGSAGSANITLLEDGVLAAPAPYAAPQALDFPALAHMEGVEVRKGSSQIRYGPRTTGGVLNLLSTSPAEDLAGHIRVSGGADNARAMDIGYGDSWKSASWMLQALTASTNGFATLDGGGDTGFDVNDAVGALRLRAAPDAPRYQEVTFTAGRRSDTSHASGVGLADADFREHPYRRYAATREDMSTADAWRGVVRHFVALNDRVDITTTIYRHDLDFESDALASMAGTPVEDVVTDPASHASEYAILTGASASADDAIAVHAGTQSFYAQGIESVVGLRAGGGGWNHAIEIGARYHKDEEDRLFRTDGYRIESPSTMVRSSRGIDGGNGGADNQVNDARAFAAYAQDRVTRGKVSLEPGVRVEWIEVTRSQYAAADADRSTAPIQITNTTTVLLPGLGVVVRATPGVDVFAGAYRGFSPPAPGLPDSADAAHSVDVEAGLRVRADHFRGTVLGYVDDTDGLAGSAGAAEPFNAGSTRVAGAEVSVEYAVRTADYSVTATAAYTYANAEFRSTFDSDYAPWGAVNTGDGVPYVPSHAASATLEFGTKKSYAGVSASYVGRMRTVPGTGSADVTTDARFLLDITTEYQIIRHVRIFATVENVTDAVYVATRFPAGVRPGMPQTFAAGLKLGL